MAITSRFVNLARATATPMVHRIPSSARFMATYSNARLPASLGFFVVPQQSAWVVERFGKFHSVLSPGLHFAIPMVDRVAYCWNLKEQALSISNQAAVTKDNVTIQIDGVLYLRVTDPEAASYGVEDAIFALQQLAQTTMRSELGKMSLDDTFEQRGRINASIVSTINEAAATWGVECKRYEIRDILPPTSVRVAMDMQAEAERRKRAEITEAEGRKQAVIRRAQADAEAIYTKAEATAKSIQRMAHSVVSTGGAEVVAARLAEQYVQAFSELAKKGNTLILPANAGDPAQMVGQALGMYEQIRKSISGPDAAPAPPGTNPPAGPSADPDASPAEASPFASMLVDETPERR